METLDPVEVWKTDEGIRFDENGMVENSDKNKAVISKDWIIMVLVNPVLQNLRLRILGGFSNQAIILGEEYLKGVTILLHL